MEREDASAAPTRLTELRISLKSRSTLLDFGVSAGLFLAALGLFLSTASTTLQGGDSGELMTVAARGGVPHPPGFPVYLALSSFAAAIPVGDVVFRLSALSAVGAALAVLFAFVAGRASGVARSTAVLAACGFALTPSFWRLAGVAEVFSWAAAFLIAASWMAQISRHRWAGLLLGLGMAVHPAVIVGLPMVSWNAREKKPSVMLCVGLGLSAYLGLLFVRDGGWRWGDTSGIPGLLHHVLRLDYGVLTLAGETTGVRGAHALRFLTEIPARWLAFVVPVVIGVVLGGWRAGVPILCALAFFALFNLGVRPLEIAVVERFYVLGDAMLLPSLVLGLQRIVTWRRSAAVLFGASIAVSLGLGHRKADWRGDVAVERYTRDMLASAARSALILGQGDVPTFTMLFAKQVWRLRPDVHYVDVGLLTHRWYYEWVRRELGVVGSDYDPERVDTISLITFHARARPVYLTQVYSSAVRALISHPEGLLIRVLPKGTARPACEEVKRDLERLGVPLVRSENHWTSWVAGRYSAAWRALASCYEGIQQFDSAQGARRRAAEIEAAP